ncbi:LysR family transcriptional regulator [Achromobacter aloeverae]|uniref:LysR family transcriptional regulator n=1 Tax=Achromobacter aloeverae TaxID=1750518 RepID=A0A4Q1HDT0_9BURK|nr:LysR family transcriptional regulator [Achromobacter aloeverae]RXN83371.1 LysR family transcriptional regulator [Achromobacter aloeverae]
MTLKQLEAFYWAAKLGSFAIAAQRLHVTQSSLSKRIAELEASIGAPLFDRSSLRAVLTDLGQRTVPLASQMLSLSDTVRGLVAAPEGLHGICKFGISELGSLTWLPRFVAKLRDAHPGLVLRPYVDLARQLERRVMRGELDFAVSPGPSPESDLQAEVMSEVRFSWMGAPARMGSCRALRPDDFERHPVITMTEDSGLTRAFDAWAAAQGLQVQRILACNSLLAITGLTVAGIGISFLPAAYMGAWVKQGTLVELASTPPLPTLDYCFLSRRDDSRGMIRTLRNFVREAVDFSGGLPAPPVVHGG